MKRVMISLLLFVLFGVVLLGCPARDDALSTTAGNTEAETGATENKLWIEENETTGVVDSTVVDEELFLTESPTEPTTGPTSEATAETEVNAPQEPTMENTTQKTEETTIPDETESDETAEIDPTETIETKSEETTPETEATLPEADTSNMLEGN